MDFKLELKSRFIYGYSEILHKLFRELQSFQYICKLTPQIQNSTVANECKTWIFWRALKSNQTNMKVKFKTPQNGFVWIVTDHNSNWESHYFRHLDLGNTKKRKTNEMSFRSFSMRKTISEPRRPFTSTSLKQWANWRRDKISICTRVKDIFCIFTHPQGIEGQLEATYNILW